MNKSVVSIQVRAVIPTSGGSAVFLGNEEKVFVIYVDQSVGAAITMFMQHIPKQRPQTHDLIGDIFTALGAHVERVIINNLQDGIFFARIILVAKNEISEQKIVEIDARPSDCIAIAIQQSAPLFVSEDVWEEVEDMSKLLSELEHKEQGDDDDSLDTPEEE